VRADQLLVMRGLASSRTLAQRLIAAGRVRAGAVPVRKPADLLHEDAELQLEPGADDRFVSRGGLKLEAALAQAAVVVEGKVCLDVGQSTGGFTDCLLRAGAVRVVGVDVGHGQLDARLRVDPRVACFERINARTLTPDTLGPSMPVGGFPLIVADLSFISLLPVLPALRALGSASAMLVALVKPQFELGAQALDRHGIARDPQAPAKAYAIVATQAQALGWTDCRPIDSPIAGGDGNRECFLVARWPRSAAPDAHSHRTSSR
jgi:23S rRNA (cytidine1920-2'-O)/16S rRNA (cytidine1409-2'-O)-methyltransferase